MKTKLTVLKAKHPIIVSFILSGVWIGFMLLVAFTLGFVTFITNTGTDYLGQFFIDLAGTIFGIVLIFMFSYEKVFKEKTYGIGKGLVTGSYFIIVSLLAIVANIFTVINNSTSGTNTIISIEPIGNIIIFILTMFLIGAAEELTFRGVIANILFDKYGKSSAGVWFATIMVGSVFGSMHLFNSVNPEISLYSALIQAIAASVIGMALTAVYYRSRNIWLVIFLHGLIDFGSLFASGVLGVSSIASNIGSYSSINLIAIIPYSIVVIVLLRKKKMTEIIGENPMDSSKKEKRNLSALIIGLVVIIIGTFISGLLASSRQGEVITSYSGTFIDRDWTDVITVPDDGKYEIIMGAENVTDGCLVDQYLQDDEGTIHARHLMDSGIGYFEDIELSAGNYTFKTVVLSTLEEFESYLEQTKYEIDDQAREEFMKMINKTEPGTHSVDMSFVLTKKKE